MIFKFIVLILTTNLILLSHNSFSKIILDEIENNLKHPDKIGSLRKVTNHCYIQRESNKVKIKAVNGLDIYQNDIVSTEKDSSLGIIFRDGTRISLGENSKLSLSKYIFNPAEKKYSMLTKIMKGSASYISGKLSKLAPGSVKIETPDATIGIRGTSLLIKVEEH